MDAAALHVNSGTDVNSLVERDLDELVRLELAVQRALADPQDLGRLATIALRLAQRGSIAARSTSAIVMPARYSTSPSGRGAASIGVPEVTAEPGPTSMSSTRPGRCSSRRPQLFDL